QYSGTLMNGWPAIDGAMLFAVPIEETSEHTIFSSPILLNGKKASLRYARAETNSDYEILGVWGGVSARTGTAEKKISPLQVGDEITVMCQLKEEGGINSSFYEGDTVIVNQNTVIQNKRLEQDYYQYAFVLTDLFGNKYFSNSAVFERDETGNYSIIAVSADVDKEAYSS
ncbi:MAG: hypothetical protein RSG57_03835, partial [Christensenellaceae bacterium]